MDGFFSRYGFMIAMLSFATAMDIVWFFFVGQKRKLLPGWGVILVSVSHTLFAVLGALVFGWMESGFQTFGSISLFGCLLFLPLFDASVALISKKPFSEVFDCLTPCILFGLICMRINCLHAGCCLGKIIEGGDGARYPTREIELVFHAIIAIVLMAVCWKEKARGLVFPVYLVAYGAFRFACEFFREQTSYVGPLHLSQIWAIVSFAIGLGVLVFLIHGKKGSTNAE